METYKPTFGIPLIPVEVVSGKSSSSSGKENKEFSSSKWWFIGGLLAIGIVGYFVFKK